MKRDPQDSAIPDGQTARDLLQRWQARFSRAYKLEQSGADDLAATKFAELLREIQTTCPVLRWHSGGVA